MLISCIIGIISGVILIPITTEESLLLKALVLMLLMCVLYIWFLNIKLFKQEPSAKKLMPKLSSFTYDENRNIINFILRNTKLLSYSSFVTLYFVESNIEHYFATGKIINIQDNDIAQVTIIHFNDRYDHKKDDIISNNIGLISSIVVKLSFHDSFINTLNLGGIYNV